MKRIIIWLFEKFAYDYWVEQQMEKERKDFIERHNLQDYSEQEINEYMVEYQDRDKTIACEQAYQTGYNNALNDFNI